MIDLPMWLQILGLIVLGTLCAAALCRGGKGSEPRSWRADEIERRKEA